MAPSRQLGLCWGLASVACALMAPLAPGAASMAPDCLFRAITGFPCPTCGATRAVTALARLDLAGAAAFNPLVTVGALFFLVGGVVAAIAALAARPLPEPPLTSRAARWAGLTAVCANWAWVLWRLR